VVTVARANDSNHKNQGAAWDFKIDKTDLIFMVFNKIIQFLKLIRFHKN
jgi:hypothetical protein